MDISKELCAARSEAKTLFFWGGGGIYMLLLARLEI